jgi:hypothetical protein
MVDSGVLGPVQGKNIRAGSTWWSLAPHLMAARKQRERQEEAGVPISTSMIHSNDLISKVL